jgi:hypothetical protein
MEHSSSQNTHKRALVNSLTRHLSLVHLPLLLAIILFLSTSAGTAVAQRYSGGNGSPEKPFKISSTKDMDLLAEAVNSGRTYVDTCFLLTKDVEGVTAIVGGLDRPFEGIFDGNGHKITANISVVHTASFDSTDVGLFGHVNNGVIRNLGVAGQITISRSSEEIASFWILGGICGRVSGNSLIDNCYNEAEIHNYAGYISSRSAPADNYPNSGSTGGICGIARNGATISNCYNAGKITRSYYAGGICGLAYNATITGCRNISAGFDLCVHIGGICGDVYAGSLISDCSNAADISYVDAQDHIASISGICIGLFASTVINCYNSGNLSGLGNVCGIINYMTRTRDGGGASHLSNCYNTGNLSGSNVAGIFHNNHDNTVSNCYNTGKISATGRASGICSTAGEAYSNGDSYMYKGIVTDCYNTGDVSVISSEYVPGVGGIAAMSFAENIINCYNSGNVSVTRSGNTDKGVAFVGGICGYGGGKITNCVVACDSIYSQRETNNSYTGRISGPFSNDEYAHLTIENCHANASLKFNGTVISSQDATSRQGKDLADPAGLLSSVDALRNMRIAYGDVVDLSTDNLAVTFRSSDTEVAEASGNILTALKTGETTLTADFAWSEGNYFRMSIPQRIEKRDLRIAAGEHSRLYGDPNPEFTLAYSGFANGDSEEALDELPSISCPAGATSPVGFYEVVLSGGSDDNYTYFLENGVLEIRLATAVDVPATQNSSDAEEATVYDLSGKMMLKVNLKPGNNRIDDTDLPKGVYLVKRRMTVEKKTKN